MACMVVLLLLLSCCWGWWRATKGKRDGGGAMRGTKVMAIVAELWARAQRKGVKTPRSRIMSQGNV